MATKIQLRRGIAALWTSEDPTLSQGEIGIETDTNKIKIGDGLTAWTSLDYFSSSAGFEDPMTTRGDVIYKNSSNTTTRLPVGTNGQVLTTDGTDLSWGNQAAGFEDPMTTRGDLIYKDSSNNTSRLAIGTVGQVLTSDGTDISWDDAAAGYTDEEAQDAVGTILTDSSTIDFTYTDATPEITADVIDGSITLAKMDDMATASLIYRKTAGDGAPEVNTLATLKTDLDLTGTNTGDNTVCTSGTATTAETLATARAIYGNNFDGSAALTQVIASTYGGTGNGFTKFTGASTSEKTYTLPNANATIATTSDLHDAVTIGTANGLSLSTQALSLALSSTSTTGALSDTDWDTFNNKAEADQTMYIGTTGVAINRSSSALTLAGITLTTPDIGTPSAGTLTNCTGLPYSGIADGTDGELITWAADGTADTVSVGTAGQVLTSNGTGAAPTFQDTASLDLDPTPDTDETVEGITSTMTVGESVTFGQMLYMKSDGKLWKAKADDSATMPIIAMAAASISADASGSVLLHGFARDDTWTWTVGTQVYGSNVTAGDTIQTLPSDSGDQVQVIGMATHADRMYFKPDLALIEVA